MYYITISCIVYSRLLTVKINIILYFIVLFDRWFKKNIRVFVLFCSGPCIVVEDIGHAKIYSEIGHANLIRVFFSGKEGDPPVCEACRTRVHAVKLCTNRMSKIWKSFEHTHVMPSIG